MRFRAFVNKREKEVGETARRGLFEGTFRDVVDATRQQKAREEQQAVEQGQIAQNANAQHSLQQAVEKCNKLVEFVRDTEQAVATGELSMVQSRATEMRGVATGLLQILNQLGGTRF